jgi:hypothetical protein
MNRADIAAIPYGLLWYFLNESGNADHFLSADEVRTFLQVSNLPTTGSQIFNAEVSSERDAPAGVTFPRAGNYQLPREAAKKAAELPGKPKVKRLALRDAIARYVADPRNAGFDDKKIIAEIRAMFPDFAHIGRDAILVPLRDIVGKRTPGPKPFREENSAE